MYIEDKGQRSPRNMPYRHGDGGSRDTVLFVFNLGWVILSLLGLEPQNIQSRSESEDVG